MKNLILLAVVLLSVAASAQTQTYKGAWFKVNYPNNFTAQPSYPSAEGGKNTFDAATFTSPDKKVAFFIFAPMMPKETLPDGVKLDGISQTNPADNLGNITSYYSYYSPKDKYTHSYQVTTYLDGRYDLIIGIRYSSMNDYEKYHKQYVAFKKSLKRLYAN